MMAQEKTLSCGRLFWLWLRIGGTSFGGGAMTQYMIQDAFVFRENVLTQAQYVRLVGICQLAPGINILALTLLIGRRVAGWRGSIVALLGLLLPSAMITVLISSLYLQVRDWPRMSAVLKTVFAAILGISLANGWRNASPILRLNQKRGKSALGIALAVLVTGVLLQRGGEVPVALAYGIGGAICAIAYSLQAGQRKE